MKIGLDIHGVIDRYQEVFIPLTQYWAARGFEIHIITGQERSESEPGVRELGIVFTHFHSIVDWHRSLGTHMWKRTDGGGWWMERDVWTMTKGEIASAFHLDLHFDDQLEYAEAFPSYCTFIWVRDNFEMTNRLLTATTRGIP